MVQRSKTEVPSFLEPFWGKQVKEASGSIQNWPFLSELITKYSIDNIVHAAAAGFGPGAGSLYDAISINVAATCNGGNPQKRIGVA